MHVIACHYLPGTSMPLCTRRSPFSKMVNDKQADHAQPIDSVCSWAVRKTRLVLPFMHIFGLWNVNAIV